PASMHDRWDGILGNVTVKMFMRVNNVEPRRLARRLPGSQHSFIPYFLNSGQPRGCRRPKRSRCSSTVASLLGISPIEWNKGLPWLMAPSTESPDRSVTGASWAPQVVPHDRPAADPSPDKNAHPSRQVRAFRCGVAE